MLQQAPVELGAIATGGEGLSLGSVPIEEIEEVHLKQLVEDGVVEARDIDYKLTLPGGSDADRREFLADVSSFANAGGGDIVFGLDESGGGPTDVTGLADNLDAAALRLEGSIRDGVAPRIQGVRSRPIPLSNGKNALVLRVPRSIARPHVVVFKNLSRFFTRSSNGTFLFAMLLTMWAVFGQLATIAYGMDELRIEGAMTLPALLVLVAVFALSGFFAAFYSWRIMGEALEGAGETARLERRAREDAETPVGVGGVPRQQTLVMP